MKALTATGLGSALENYRVHIDGGATTIPASSTLPSDPSLSLQTFPPSRQASFLLRPGPALADLTSEQYAMSSAIVRTPAGMGMGQPGLQRAISNFTLEGGATLAAGAEDEEKKQPDAAPSSAAAAVSSSSDAHTMPPPASIPPKNRAVLQQKMRENKARTKAKVAERLAQQEGEHKEVGRAEQQEEKENEQKDRQQREEKDAQADAESPAQISSASKPRNVLRSAKLPLQSLPIPKQLHRWIPPPFPCRMSFAPRTLRLAIWHERWTRLCQRRRLLRLS